MAMYHPPVIELADHCAALSKLLNALTYQHPEVTKKDEETYSWSQPAEWLELAASVVSVEVVTAQGDSSLKYCGTAISYEDDRSKLFSQLATSIAIFSFVWGAFESVTAILNPPSIPKPERKDGNNTPVARAVYALRSIMPDGVYRCRLEQIRHLMAVLPEYSDCLPVGIGPVAAAEAGEGINLVRGIRNKFAHGAATLPKRDDWNGKETAYNRLVRLSSRMVLLTVQMMLRVHFAGRSLKVDIYEFGASDDCLHEVHSHLKTLHLARERVDADGANVDQEPDRSEETA